MDKLTKQLRWKPARRRRVMSTSDSEAERDQTPHRPLPLQPSQAQTAALDGDQLASERDDAGTGAPDAPEIVALSSSSEDSMYIPRRQASGGANEPARQTIRAGTTRSRRNSQPGAGATGRTSVGKKRSKKTEPKFCGEASESSTTDKPSSDCSESDADAQCLYRSAISGVRNANNARLNLRRQTVNCPVCAKFAAYLQHFL